MGKDKIKIVAFGASSSSTSINRRFALYAASRLGGNTDLITPDLNDYEMPIFSVDREKKDGYPSRAHEFIRLLAESDGIILSMAEHNGSYTTAFKNLMDWCSRIESKFFADKPMLLLSTSPGGRAAGFVMEAAKTRFPLHGANIVATFSLPQFSQNFDEQNGITDPQLNEGFMSGIKNLQKALDITL